MSTQSPTMPACWEKYTRSSGDMMNASLSLFRTWLIRLPPAAPIAYSSRQMFASTRNRIHMVAIHWLYGRSYRFASAVSLTYHSVRKSVRRNPSDPPCRRRGSCGPGLSSTSWVHHVSGVEYLHFGPISRGGTDLRTFQVFHGSVVGCGAPCCPCYVVSCCCWHFSTAQICAVDVCFF